MKHQGQMFSRYCLEKIQFKHRTVKCLRQTKNSEHITRFSSGEGAHREAQPSLVTNTWCAAHLTSEIQLCSSLIYLIARGFQMRF